VQASGRLAFELAPRRGTAPHTAWFTPKGLISVEANRVPQFQVRDCRLSYGLLAFLCRYGPLLCPTKLTGAKDICIPSTRWFVGLVDGNDSMLVARLGVRFSGLSLWACRGEGETSPDDSLSMHGEEWVLALVVEHAGLGTGIAEEDGSAIRPDRMRSARSRPLDGFILCDSRRRTVLFASRYMDYSFPLLMRRRGCGGLCSRTGTIIPSFSTGPHTVFHFEKTFVPHW